MPSLIKITQNDFNKATEILKEDSRGFFLEFSLSTDRTCKYDSSSIIVELAEKIKKVTDILYIDQPNFPVMTHDYNDSDHESVTKKIYFLTKKEFGVNYIFEDEFFVKEYNPSENIALVERINNPKDQKLINTLNKSNVKNYFII